MFKVKNGRSDDVRWEDEDEVRKAEEQQAEDLKEFVNLKLPGAFTGLQKVIWSHSLYHLPRHKGHMAGLS